MCVCWERRRQQRKSRDQFQLLSPLRYPVDVLFRATSTKVCWMKKNHSRCEVEAPVYLLIDSLPNFHPMVET